MYNSVKSHKGALKVMSSKQRINCMKCRYFYITGDQKFPKGCRAFGFKTKHMPSMSVLAASGSPCQSFEAKS
jgi:hypothetical protein